MNDFAWLGALRHGESAANVAFAEAEASGAHVVDVELPDHAIGLTETGRSQARAFGERLAARPEAQRPNIIVTSTYRRAAETAEIVASELEAAAIPADERPADAIPSAATGAVARLGTAGAAANATVMIADERLRDRELGVLDRLTRAGLIARFPDEAARRAYLGKFYHRPPGGESWADVALRMRAALGDLRARYAGQRVLMVTHEAVIFLLRYIIEETGIAEIETLSRSGLANAGLTSWEHDGGCLRLASFDDTAAVGMLATRQGGF